MKKACVRCALGLLRSALGLLIVAGASVADAQGRAATHKLHVTVSDSATGQVLPGSQVIVSGQSVAFIVPESGTVSIDLAAPARDTITVRRLGYVPVTFALSLRPSEVTSLAVTLDPSPQRLPEVNVISATDAALTRIGFYDRRMRAGGFFVGPEQMERQKPARLSDVLAGDPQIRFVPAGSGGRNVRFTRARDCPPVVYVDGVLLVSEPQISRTRQFIRGTQRTRETSSDATSQQDKGIDEIAVRHVAAVEAYPNATHAPPQYAGSNSGCGVILVWTGAFLEHGR